MVKDKKTFNISGKVDSNATNVPMDKNDNAKNPGGKTKSRIKKQECSNQ